MSEVGKHPVVHGLGVLGGARPGEGAVCPLERLSAQLLEQSRLLVHVGDLRCQLVRCPGWHEKARHTVEDGVLDAADVRADDWRAARHCLHRGDAKGLVPGRGEKQIGRAVIELERRPRSTPDECDVFGDTGRRRDCAQSSDLRCGSFVGFVRFTAHYQQSGWQAVLVDELSQRLNHGVDPLAWYEPTELQQDSLGWLDAQGGACQ